MIEHSEKVVPLFCLRSYNSLFVHSRYPQFFLTNADDKTKGVGIFLSKAITFSLKEVIWDPEGRYILLSGYVNRDPYTFI